MRKFVFITTGALGVLIAAQAAAQQWEWTPIYDLPRNAAVHAPAPQDTPILAADLPPAPLFFGDRANQSQLLADEAPQGDMTLELWLLDHVNQTVGVVLHAGDATLGFRSGAAVFGPEAAATRVTLAEEGYLERWRHLVAVRRGATWTFYENGEMKQQTRAPRARASAGPIRIDGYLARERFMQIDNLVRAAAVEPRAFTAEEVSARYQERKKLVDEGRLVSDRLHFTQSPYLNTPRMDAIELSFEFDRHATAIVEYGLSEDALTRAVMPTAQTREHGVTLSGLTADTPYFYRVTGVDAEGHRIDSGLLSFRTAPPAGRPFTFVVTGDTEARPHVNNALSQLMWDERPNLLAIMGDLTDGGQAAHRYEWTHEYFTGMGPFFGRVPTLGVPGNGELDLQWFRHYHRQPGAENYFSLVYGDVEFFVLDSHLDYQEERDPGFRARQRAWLESALRASTARWKIAMHHHDVRTSDENDYGDTWRTTSSQGDAEVQADFLPLYERYGVDLVFFAHLHSYERSWPIRAGRVDLENGVTYVQVGGAGGNLEDFAPNKPWFSRKTFRDHHYALVSVTPQSLEVQTFDIEGHLRDAFALH